MIVIATFLLIAVVYGASIPRRHTGLDTHLDKRQYGLAHTQRINASRPDFSPVHLDILTKTGGRNDTSPLLYGVIFEDITVGLRLFRQTWLKRLIVDHSIPGMGEFMER